MDCSRRRFLASGGVAITAGLAGCSVNNAGNDGLMALSPADGSELWTREIGGVDADPLVVDDTLYVGSDETMYALSPTDGSELWTATVSDTVIDDPNRPTVLEDLVLVPTGESVVALSTADGSEQWRFTPEERVWDAPPVSDSTVVVGAGEETMYGVSLADGSEQWQFTGEQLESESAAAIDGTAVCNSRAGRVYGLDLVDGTERWTAETADPVGGRPAVGDGTVFVGTTGSRVYAFAADDGTTQWDFEASNPNMSMGSGSYSEVQFVDDHLYVASHTVLHVIPTDGRDSWTENVHSTFSHAVADESVFLGFGKNKRNTDGGRTKYGVASAFDRDGGGERWSNTLNNPVGSPLGVGPDAIYLTDSEGILRSLARTDGDERWTYEATGVADRVEPLVTDEAVVVVTE